MSILWWLDDAKQIRSLNAKVERLQEYERAWNRMHATPAIPLNDPGMIRVEAQVTVDGRPVAYCGREIARWEFARSFVNIRARMVSEAVADATTGLANARQVLAEGVARYVAGGGR